MSSFFERKKKRKRKEFSRSSKDVVVVNCVLGCGYLKLFAGGEGNCQHSTTDPRVSYDKSSSRCLNDGCDYYEK